MAALVAPLLSLAPAHAAEPNVALSREVRVVPLDSGWLAEVTCTARAEGGSTTQVGLITAVTCSAGSASQTRALPGPVAATVVSSAVTGPFVVCVSGEAAFIDPVSAQNPTVERGPECTTVNP